MKRNEHTFQFTGKQIATAAREEFGYHYDRLMFWNKEHEKAIATAKASGVDIREVGITGGKRVEVILDPSVQNRLNECASKIATHRQAADKYQIEAASYATQESRVFELHPDDIVYFRLVGGPRPID